MTLYIQPIVDGDTEETCLSKLLHRNWKELLNQNNGLQVLEPLRCKRDKLINPKFDELERFVKMAQYKLAAKTKQKDIARSLILILTDAEKDSCPAQLGPNLLTRGKSFLQNNVDLTCVVANRMFENWFVAGASSLGGVSGLPNPLPNRSEFEDFSGKNWLDKQKRLVDPTRKYKETLDSLEFTKFMNLAACRVNSPSFDKLCRELAVRISPPISENQESQGNSAEI